MIPDPAQQGRIVSRLRYMSRVENLPSEHSQHLIYRVNQSFDSAFGLAVHSGRGTKRGLCGTITLVNDLAVWSNPQEWKSTTFSDTTGERARLACWFWRQNELPMI